MNDKPKYNPHIHHRRSIRLKGYDYSQEGLYYITICVQDKVCMFGNVGAPLVGAQNDDDTSKNMNTPNMGVQNDDGADNDATHDATVVPPNVPIMILNDAGKMIETEWLKLTERFRNIELHEYVVMPNHFHGILQILDTSPGKTVGDMMDAFKSITTVEYIHGVKQLQWKPFNGKLWQRNYWEHIIRDDQSYQTISDYIIDNPSKWKADKFFNQ